MFASKWVNGYRCLCVCMQRRMEDVFIYHLLPYSLKTGSLTECYMANELPVSSYPWAPKWGYRHAESIPAVHEYWGFKLRSSYLHSKCPYSSALIAVCCCEKVPWPNATWKERVVWIIGYSPSLREVREGSLRREWKQTMDECRWKFLSCLVLQLSSPKDTYGVLY